MLNKVELLINGEIVFSESVDAFWPDDSRAFTDALRMGVLNTIGAMQSTGHPHAAMSLLAQTAQEQIDKIRENPDD